MRTVNRTRRECGNSAFHIPHSAFTLVELLVVITIIGILAALLLAAVQRARVAAQRGVITAEINQIDTAIKDMKNSVGSFPPNAQTDDLVLTGNESATTPIVENTVLTDFKQFLLKAFPQHREPEALIKALVGQSTMPPDTNIATNLPGGMTASEALVFWIGGFSDNSQYPISGPGGPSYPIPASGDASEVDPIDERSWQLGVKVQNLGPRGEDGFFAKSYNRFITYSDPRDTTGNAKRRINMWVLTPGNSPVPYVYFDASRGTGVTAANDVPAATSLANFANSRDLEETLNQTKSVYPIKQFNPSAGASLRYQFANNGSFQILHAGVDREWVSPDPVNPNLWVPMPHVLTDGTMTPTETLYADGPWTAELADTQANFANGTLEGAQP